jgi:signal transduction histidine kinase
MNIASLTALLSAIVNLAIGLSVVLRDRHRRTFVTFSLFAFSLAFYELWTFLAQALGAPLFAWLSILCAIALPPAALSFFRSFLADDARKPPPWPKPITVTAVVLCVALGYIALSSRRLLDGPLFQVPLAAYMILGLYSGVFEVYQKRRQSIAPVEKQRLLYLLVGAAAAVTFGLTAFIPGLSGGLQATGNVIAILYMYFLSQTLFRYRLLDLNELLGKMVVLSTLVLLLSAIYWVLLVWVGQEQRGLFFFNTVVASFVILILFDTLRAWMEESVNRRLFRQKYELRRGLEVLRRRLANVIDVRELPRATMEALDASRRVTHASIYLLDQEGSSFDLAGHLGPRPTDRMDLAARRPLVDKLKASGVLTLEGLAREQQARQAAGDDKEVETLDAVGQALGEMSASVCIPISGDEELLGLLCLRDERLREAYSSDELDLFRQLAAQMGICIENSHVYERMKERDRLAALGEMAAGLAHEIRNPLGAIKGAAQFLLPSEGRPPEPTPGTEGEFLGIIVEEVNRLNRVVSQFLDYARPYRGEPAPLDLNDVVRKTNQLLEREIKEAADRPGARSGARVDVQVVLADALPRVRADSEQLRQVFLNLGLNAIQAMPDGGRLTISTSQRKGRRGTPAGMLEVRFRDTGTGIAPEKLKKLFIPFFTTKERGTGLGLPISQRIVQNHGGSIEVRSQVGKGTTFTVLLPVETTADVGEAVVSARVRPDATSRPVQVPASLAAASAAGNRRE